MKFKLSLESLEVRENPAGPVIDDPLNPPPPPSEPPPAQPPEPPPAPPQPVW